MKYLSQFLYILLFSLLGELLEAVIPLPIPAAIYGLLLLLLALMTGLVKERQVSQTADFLISLLPVLFVPPLAKILLYWGLIGPHLAAIAIIVAVSTVFIFAVSGLLTRWLQKRKRGQKNG